MQELFPKEKVTKYYSLRFEHVINLEDFGVASGKHACKILANLNPTFI